METKDIITALAALAHDTRLAVFRLLVVVYLQPAGNSIARQSDTIPLSPPV
jgi:hypothetical protein